jgi:hypothetical protein
MLGFLILYHSTLGFLLLNMEFLEIWDDNYYRLCSAAFLNQLIDRDSDLFFDLLRELELH